MPGYAADLETAKAVPELDLILGGHSHTFLGRGGSGGPIFDATKGANGTLAVGLGSGTLTLTGARP
jgi:2',3'-cyclic-nucleotide 2'-phosphodiesterase (5'-nucleotidase family)